MSDVCFPITSMCQISIYLVVIPQPLDQFSPVPLSASQLIIDMFNLTRVKQNVKYHIILPLAFVY